VMEAAASACSRTSHQFLPIIIKINNEIELTSQVPRHYYAPLLQPAGKNSAASDTPPDVTSFSNTDPSAVKAASQTTDNAAAAAESGGSSYERCRKQADIFEGGSRVVCRHLEGSPGRNRASGCNGRQCRKSPAGRHGHRSGGRFYDQSQEGAGRHKRAGHRDWTVGGGGSVPAARPVLVRQHHLDTDVHPDLTRKRHSCVAAGWFRGGRTYGRHRRTESI
jgi:hypothetical protein